MAEHRVRLSDNELELLVRACSARQAGSSPKMRRELLRLAERLSACAPGSPYLRFGWKSDWNIEWARQQQS